MRHHFHKFLLGLVSSAFTAFVFMNTYEVVFNQDIVFAHSVKRIEAQTVINNIVKDFAIKSGSTGTSSTTSPLNNLEHLEIPALNTRVSLEAGRKINDLWYQRPSMAHYIGLNKDDSNITIDYLIYTDKSWQVIPYPEQIEEGMDVKFYYDKGATSLFKVAEKRVLPFDRSFIINKTEDRQILLVVEDPRTKQYYGFSLVSQK